MHTYITLHLHLPAELTASFLTCITCIALFWWIIKAVFRAVGLRSVFIGLFRPVADTRESQTPTGEPEPTATSDFGGVASEDEGM